MGFITKGSGDINEQKMEMILTQHHEAIRNEKRIYQRIGTPLMNKVTLQGGNIVTMQQAICTTPSSDGGQLFSGVEYMGDIDTVLFTYHKRHHGKDKTTVNKFWRAIQGILLSTSYNELGLGSHTHHPSKLKTVQNKRAITLTDFLI